MMLKARGMGCGAVRALAAAGCAIGLFGAGPPARADVRPLTLYERTGRAPLVVWGEVADAEHRLAAIRTLEVVKCAIPERPGGTFRIAYKLDSFLRPPWQDRITFANKERVLLFLRKFTKQDGEKPEGDIFTLMWGAQGRVTLPAEGEQAWTDAVRAFVGIQAHADLETQARLLREALASVNPLISDGAFEETLKQGLGDLQMVPELVRYFDASREPTRINAMRLLRQILSDARSAGRAVPERQQLADLIRGRAAGDASASFRVEAVQTLSVLGGEDVKAFLRRLAKEDPSQFVRYEAERSLLGWPEGP